MEDGRCARNLCDSSVEGSSKWARATRRRGAKGVQLTIEVKATVKATAAAAAAVTSFACKHSGSTESREGRG
jgi:hypothetical protein